MYLIDTCVWIDWLCERETAVTRALDGWLDEGTARLAPVSVQELLHGARGPRELDILRQRFTALPRLPATLATHAEAGALYARCRWQGITIRSPHDCLIAALAIEYATPLLTLDRDFEAIAAIEPRLVLEKPESL